MTSNNSDDAPKQAPYSRHIFICSGSFCENNGKAIGLYNKLPRMLGEMGRYDNPDRIKRGLTPCLGVCQGGPLMVVYPDGVWYHHLDEEKLERIIDEHLIDGNPVDEYTFHKTQDNDNE